MSESDTLYSLPPYNFLGVPNEFTDFKKSKFLVLPVPYDSTVSYGVGSRNGPRAILEASRFVEFLDLETKKEVYTEGVHTLNEIEVCRGDAKETWRRVTQTVQDVLVKAEKTRKDRFLITLGGEHGLSAGVVAAYPKDVVYVYFDAHGDLRDELDGSRYAHGCHARRTAETGRKVVGIGIRAISPEELDYAKDSKTKLYLMQDLKKNMKASLASLAKELKGKKVYLSVDVDVLDPSEAPGTGTPEPDGFRYAELVDFIRTICKSAKVVGFDLCEIAPTGTDKVSEFLGARLTYKVMNLVK